MLAMLLANGIVTKSGERLDYGCGIGSRTTVSNALKSLTELGFLEQVAPNDIKKNEGASWTIAVGQDYEHDKVNFSALMERAGARAKKNKKRISKARQRRYEKQKNDDQTDPVSETDQVYPVSGTDHLQSVGLTTPGQWDRPPLVSRTDSQNPDLNPVLNPEETQREEAPAQKPNFDSMGLKEILEVPEIKMFKELTNFSPGFRQVEVIWEIIHSHGFTKEYLQPFFDEWTGLRGKPPNDLIWLAEWAVEGKIPFKVGGDWRKESQNGKRLKPRSSDPQRRDPTPEELERGRAAARQRKLEIEARLQGV